MLLVGTISKQATQVDIDSRRVFALDRIANANCTLYKTLLNASNKHEDLDVGTIVLVDAIFARNKNDKLRFHDCFRERTGESQHVTRV